MPFYLYPIPFLWAMVGMSAAVNLGVYEDFGLTIAGVVAVVMIMSKMKKIGKVLGIMVIIVSTTVAIASAEDQNGNQERDLFVAEPGVNLNVRLTNFISISPSNKYMWKSL